MRLICYYYYYFTVMDSKPVLLSVYCVKRARVTFYTYFKFQDIYNKMPMSEKYCFYIVNICNERANYCRNISFPLKSGEIFLMNFRTILIRFKHPNFRAIFHNNIDNISNTILMLLCFLGYSVTLTA